MKTTITILVMNISLILCSCNEASKKDLSDAKDNINKANRELQQAARDSRDAAKEKTISEWKSFNEKSEKNVETLNHQIREFQKKITTADQKENLRLKNELNQNREKLKTMREKLRERNLEFETVCTNLMILLNPKMNLFNENSTTIWMNLTKRSTTFLKIM
jgi:peptidoglycan hydrolase CwlO-like protein